MEFDSIMTIINAIVSAIAVIIATFKKAKSPKSIDEIEELAEAKKQKIIAKEIKKNKIKADFQSTTTQINNETNQDSESGYQILGR